MHAAIKLLAGIILIIVGLWLLVPQSLIPAIKPESLAIFDWWSEFLTVVKGVIPPALILLGALIVWIEAEELKPPVVPEFEEEPKPKKKATKKKKKK